MAAEPLQIRSFRVCFRLERRIHKIDRWRIPLSFGLPVRSVGYAAVALLAVLFASRLPLIGALLMALPAPIRLLTLPVGIAYAATRWEIDGRPAHAAAMGYVRMWLAPSRMAAFRPATTTGAVVLGDVTVAADDRGARLRKATVAGPARLVVRYPVLAHEQRDTVVLERMPGPAQWRGTAITLRAGQRAVLR